MESRDEREQCLCLPRPEMDDKGQVLKSQKEDRSLDLVSNFRFSVNKYVRLIFMTRINHISMAKLFQRR